MKIQAKYEENMKKMLFLILFLALLSVGALNSHDLWKYTILIIIISNPCPKINRKYFFGKTDGF